MSKRIFFQLLIALAYCFESMGQPAFRVVPLGVLGGNDENNLSAYMIAPYQSNDYICMDAGTIKSGIDRAIALKSFRVSSSVVLRNYIKAYCISHAHLDHVSGMIINSPADTNKTIYALHSTVKNLQQSYFNNEAWSNFGDGGVQPLLNKYHFETLLPYTATSIDTTGMQVMAFPLSHINPYESTAFLLKYREDYVLYFGDTGPDEIEHTDKLDHIWQIISPLIKANKLKGIFIEVSFPNVQPDDKLYGHLTPKWLMTEMEKLAGYTGMEKMKGFKIVITHMKPPKQQVQVIQSEILKSNPLDLHLIFPEQGKAFYL